MNRPIVSASGTAEPRYVFVDLDGTLLRSDLFIESIIRYLRANPLRIFFLFALLFRGRAVAKAVLARKVNIDPASLPYEKDLVSHLKQCKADGRHIVLTTASHWTYARRIARYQGFFDDVLGSRARTNLKGSHKLEAIRAIAGDGPFAYAGDSRADRPIWNAAQRAIFVNAPKRDVAAAERNGRTELNLRTRPAWVFAFAKEMRLHQWAKNLLLFVPLITSHTYSDINRVGMAVLAFVVFGLCASGHYFANDLLDLDADRAHRTKRRRPLASGDLPLIQGAIGALVLPLLGFILSGLFLPPLFTLALAAYFVMTNLYSFHLKRISTADVMALAILYTVRVVAGAAAVSVVVSSWLLAFSMFMFVSLAYLKRYIEVLALADSSEAAAGRGYSGADAQTMFVLGIANATAATVVLASYISSAEVVVLYRYPEILWGLCLLMLYWSNRMWVGARRGKIDEDPLVFALKDNVSRIIGVAALIVVMVARLFH